MSNGTGDYKGFFIMPFGKRFRAILRPAGKGRKLFSTPADAKKAIDNLLAGLPIQDPKPPKPKNPKKIKRRSKKAPSKHRRIILGD